MSQESAFSIESLPLQLPHGLLTKLENEPGPCKLLGLNSPVALAALVSSGKFDSFSGCVFVFANEDQERAFANSLSFFDPQSYVAKLPHHDVSPYANLYSSHSVIANRLHWLYRAQRAKVGEFFTATIQSLAQNTIPADVFTDKTFSISAGDQWNDSTVQKLSEIGYLPSSLVESWGQYAVRGSIVDIFSTAYKNPIRIELFGDEIESIRLFDSTTQRSLKQVNRVDIPPAAEALYQDDSLAEFVGAISKDWDARGVSERDKKEILISINRQTYFHGMEFLLPQLYDNLSQPLDYFLDKPKLFILESSECQRTLDELHANYKFDYGESSEHPVHPEPEDILCSFDKVKLEDSQNLVLLDKIEIIEQTGEEIPTFQFSVSGLRDFVGAVSPYRAQTDILAQKLSERFKQWRQTGHSLFVTCASHSQAERLVSFLQRIELKPEIVDENEFNWSQWVESQKADPKCIHLITKTLSESFRLQDDNIVFLKDEDIFGSRRSNTKRSSKEEFQEKAGLLSFSELKDGDFVVHKQHGLGVFKGLKVMSIQGVDSEFIQIDYKDKDRLYVPVYKVGQIQKFSGPSSTGAVAKLGGGQWEKTKTKVKSHLRDMAAELLKLYSEREQLTRPPFSIPDADFINFESAFPYTETQDQIKAINDVVSDLTQDKPMDRLVCGDVGFGKTEVAMRAAFKCAQDRRQVCVIAPTTVLTYQHYESFRRRFKGWPLEIRLLNRFVSKADARKTVDDLKAGKVDIVLGTHRLLSKDVEFKDLGLLIIDEEQKFGVRHKERLRKLKASVDTLAMSATPIPRTLNMSLMGIRDLSIINSAPQDRLPTRTFVTKFDKESIRRAVLNETARGGQVFFVHNRVQSIYALADELRTVLPEIRMAVGHGQMEEGELEKVMVSFFNHEIDLLLCTTIIESGVDIPKANTMFINDAHQFGLSQLYQLRGRVGRSKERAYCYLLVPPGKRLEKDAQERLKVLQENTALGSGLRIAQYDLEIRGSGDLLGEHQSGHINAVGYELYLELLEEAVREARGEPPIDQVVDPEINLRIPALIPDGYIPDIKIRLGIYKTLSDIKEEYQLDEIEDQLRDQFGKPPEEVHNLMGIMLLRMLCKQLAVRDLSSGPRSISLSFTDQTRLPVKKVIELTNRPNKKYSLTPDQRLNIRMKEITWPKVYEELKYVLSLCP
ncbi:MAG: transcription-repair coupling factor [Bdellovibrionales bacterium]|nr:transcription-repair coupling factor [Bdellovibrionales bacterium]